MREAHRSVRSDKSNPVDALIREVETAANIIAMIFLAYTAHQERA